MEWKYTPYDYDKENSSIECTGQLLTTITVSPVPSYQLAGSRESSLGHTHQLVENYEFELQFDCVDHGFYRSLSDVFIGISQTNQDDIHDDTD